jgi:hypothetical protein
MQRELASVELRRRPSAARRRTRRRTEPKKDQEQLDNDLRVARRTARPSQQKQTLRGSMGQEAKTRKATTKSRFWAPTMMATPRKQTTRKKTTRKKAPREEAYLPPPQLDRR